MSSDVKVSDTNDIEPLNAIETPPPQPICLVLTPVGDEIDARRLSEVLCRVFNVSRSLPPPVNQLHPPVGQLHPPVGQLHPPVDQLHPPVDQMSNNIESIIYNMKHLKRGKCLIFNHRTYDSHLKMNERRGTDIDAKALYGCFRSLDFEVILHTDKSAKTIIRILKNVSKENHQDNDCIVIAILTHGEPGVLWARDKKYTLETVLSSFTDNQCPTLVGKPKLFFIQACQGDNVDSGVSITSKIPDQSDSGSFMMIPNYPDFLIAYSTIPGYYSWRNVYEGSWYIQALVETLEKNSCINMDLLTMLTIVNRKVAYDFESDVPNHFNLDKKKQIPCITSMLTQLVYFTSKM